MRPTPRLVDRRLAKILVILQAAVALLAVTVMWQFEGFIAALNLAYGAVLCCVANAYFAWQSFRYAGAQASRQVMFSMYRGLVGKFAIVVIGFALIFSQVKPLMAGAVFAGFMLVQAMAWIAPMLWSRQR